MVPGVELDKYATGHEMLNQKSKKQSFPKTTQNWIAEPCLPLTEILRQLVSHVPTCKHSLEEQLWYHGTLTNGIRGARKASKSAATWWLVPNLKNMPLAMIWPLAMKCQINNHKSQIFPNTKLNLFLENWWPLTTSQFTFLHCTIRLCCRDLCSNELGCISLAVEWPL